MANLYVEDELTDEGELGPVNVKKRFNNDNIVLKWKSEINNIFQKA